MKPSHLARPLTRFLGLALVMYLVGCAASAPTPGGGDDDDQPPPPMVKQPPTPKGGGGTSPGCNGVTEAGTCSDGVAEYCDVEADSLRRKDCRALGKSCVLDPSTGAKCETVGGGTGGDPGCEAGVTFDGTCGGQTATWCDAFTQQTIVWDCAGDGLTCQVDTCETESGTAIPGAFCCAAGGTPPPAQNPCPALGFEGECNGTGQARWCSGNTLIEQNCTDGKTCQVDPEIGAYCKTTTTMMTECETLGFEGRCVGGKPRWCSGGEVMEVTCSTGTQCEENGPDCSAGGGDAGAYCCAP